MRRASARTISARANRAAEPGSGTGVGAAGVAGVSATGCKPGVVGVSGVDESGGAFGGFESDGAGDGGVVESGVGADGGVGEPGVSADGGVVESGVAGDGGVLELGVAGACGAVASGVAGDGGFTPSGTVLEGAVPLTTVSGTLDSKRSTSAGAKLSAGAMFSASTRSVDCAGLRKSHRFGNTLAGADPTPCMFDARRVSSGGVTVAAPATGAPRLSVAMFAG